MNKLDKNVEDRIKAEGWIKLLPTENCDTNQPHRFRYTDGKTTSITIIQHGALASVYQGNRWQERYKQVDWDTPECKCKQCKIVEGLEAQERMAKILASFVRQFEGVDTDPVDPVDIFSLQLEKADNGYKKISFYYRISKETQ